MFRLTRTRILSISICIFRLSARAGAYAIDESCKPYSGDGQDKTALITAAMTEANLMQQAAAGAVVAPASAQDDTLTKLFPGASATDLTDIATKFTTARSNTAWAITSLNSLEQDKLTIYCGGDNFVPNPSEGPNAWTDLTSFITVYGDPTNGATTGDYCSTGAVAATLDASSQTTANAQDYKIIVLCAPALVKGVSPDSTGSKSSVAAIAADTGNAGLYAGKPINNVAYTICLSFTLVHELMHVTQSASFFRGAAELYGWDACNNLQLAVAKMNIDNYAFYALSTYIMHLKAEYFVFNGHIGSVAKSIAGGNAFTP